MGREEEHPDGQRGTQERNWTEAVNDIELAGNGSSLSSLCLTHEGSVQYSATYWIYFHVVKYDFTGREIYVISEIYCCCFQNMLKFKISVPSLVLHC